MQGLLGTTLILLAACSLAAMATAAFRVPALLGYLSVGVVLGPSVIGVIAPGETLSFLSELGVALLLFMVGLEFSLGDFWLARRTVLMAGALQMIAVAPPLLRTRSAYPPPWGPSSPGWCWARATSGTTWKATSGRFAMCCRACSS